MASRKRKTSTRFVVKRHGMVPMRKVLLKTMRSIHDSTQKTLALNDMIRSWSENRRLEKALPTIMPYLVDLNRAVAFGIAAYGCGCNGMDLIAKFGWSHEWDAWCGFQNALNKLDSQLKDTINGIQRRFHSRRALDQVRAALKKRGGKEKTSFKVEVDDLFNWHNMIIQLKKITTRLDKAQEDLINAF